MRAVTRLGKMQKGCIISTRLRLRDLKKSCNRSINLSEFHTPRGYVAAKPAFSLGMASSGGHIRRMGAERLSGVSSKKHFSLWNSRQDSVGKES